MTKAIGPTFGAELRAAGLLGLPFSWGPDGVIQFAPSMSSEQIAAVNAIYAAHDPSQIDNTPVALALLQETDGVAIRCLKAGIAYPAEWTSYVAALRAIVGGAITNSLPAKPLYPADS